MVFFYNNLFQWPTTIPPPLLSASPLVADWVEVRHERNRNIWETRCVSLFDTVENISKHKKLTNPRVFVLITCPVIIVQRIYNWYLATYRKKKNPLMWFLGKSIKRFLYVVFLDMYSIQYSLRVRITFFGRFSINFSEFSMACNGNLCNLSSSLSISTPYQVPCYMLRAKIVCILTRTYVPIHLTCLLMYMDTDKGYGHEDKHVHTVYWKKLHFNILTIFLKC
jgi:hypothetical protein